MDGPTVALNYDLNNTEPFLDFGNFHTRLTNKRRRLIDKRPRVNGDSAFAGWPTDRSKEASSSTSSIYLDHSSMDMQYGNLDPSSISSSRTGSDANNAAAAAMIAMGHVSTAQPITSLFNTTATSSATSSPPSQQQWNAATTYADTEAMIYSDVSSYNSQPYYYDHANTIPSFTNPWPSSSAQTGLYGMDTSNTSVAMDQDEQFYHVPQSHQKSMSYSEEHQPRGMRYASPMPNIFDGMSDVYGRVRTMDQSQSVADVAGDTTLHHVQILDSLSTQLIHCIAQYSLSQLQDMIKDETVEEHHAYFTLKTTFDRTRKVFASDGQLISAPVIRCFQPQHQEVLRKANIAIFITAILQSHDISCFQLNHHFLETFVPLGHRLLKWQGAILLELKTQTYISALSNSRRSSQELLEEIFPHDIDSLVLQRHPDGPSLSPSEQDFLERARSRRQYLSAEATVEEALADLRMRYRWIDFAREFATAVSKNIDGLLNTSSKSQPYNTTARNRSGSAHVIGSTSSTRECNAKTSSSKPSTESRRTMSSGSIVRQPWTKVEEQALLEGLSRVNGPHWSQILALYGRGGSVSEVLKDRNQVQLKDKARNLKLWHLKTGREVPSSLRGVTGELRKRGGARARAALEAAEEQQSTARRSSSIDDDANGPNDDQMIR